MVRDNLSGTVVQSQKQKSEAELPNGSQPPEEPARSERATTSGRSEPESGEPTESQLDLLQWSKCSFIQEPDSPDQPANGAANGAAADTLPTHLRPFSSPAEYQLVKSTYQQLQHSSYYWGPMTMEEAHEILSRAPLGTFLIRDSGQTDVFFTLSYQSDDGPTSVRVQLKELLFSLSGSHKTFASFFALLKYYTDSSCKLTVPYRRQRPERLKQMCRRAFISAHGAGNTRDFPELSPPVKDYLHAYPHCI